MPGLFLGEFIGPTAPFATLLLACIFLLFLSELHFFV